LKIEVKEYKNLEENQMMEVNSDNHLIVLALKNGKYYAVSGKCTHLGCKLVNGVYDNGRITCPCHGSQFNIEDGSVVKWIENWPKLFSSLTKSIGLDKPLASYKVELIDDKLFIHI